MSYLFVINPKAGRKKAENIKSALEKKIPLNKNYSNQKYKIIIPNSIAELNSAVKESVNNDDVSNVIAVGGDGTISTVINAIIGFKNINLGIIPQGTGNILASNLGIKNEIDLALNVVFNKNTRKIDLGSINEKPFTIMAGSGFTTDVIENLKQEEKEIFGIWAYFLESIEHLYNAKEFNFELTLDGKIIETTCIAVIVCNAGNFMGALPTLTPEVKDDDGYLDVITVSLKSLKENPVEYFELLIKYLTRDLKNDTKLKSYKAKNITIKSNPKLMFQADGDLICETPVKIKIKHKQISVLVPKENPILNPETIRIIEKLEEIFNIKLPI